MYLNFEPDDFRHLACLGICSAFACSLAFSTLFLDEFHPIIITAGTMLSIFYLDATLRELYYLYHLQQEAREDN